MKALRAGCCLVFLGLAACAAEQSLRPVEQLDERTAVTRRWMAAPIVLAPAEGVTARANPDWLHLGLVEVNRQGAYTQYLGLVAWRAGEAVNSRLAIPLPTRLKLAIASGEVTLEVAPDGLRLAGDAAQSPLAAPFGVLDVRWYAVDAPTVARLAQEGLRAVTVAAAGGEPATFVPWEADGGPGQRALAEFAASLAGPP